MPVKRENVATAPRRGYLFSLDMTVNTYNIPHPKHFPKRKRGKLSNNWVGVVGVKKEFKKWSPEGWNNMTSLRSGWPCCCLVYLALNITGI